MIAGPPRAELTPPPIVETVAAGRTWRIVWENELGGLTFELGAGQDRCFLKWTPAGNGIDLAAEAARLTWASSLIPVPRVLDRGGDGTGSWLVTTALPGQSAVSPRWKAEPARAVAGIGRALRAFHDTLPVAACPFSWSAEDRLADARRRAAAGEIDRHRWEPEHRDLGLDAALAQLADPPPIDQLVVCHGDTCAPNTLLTDDGRWSGHVDLGSLGVADRWADLAIATWSTNWNYGPGWEEPLLDAYGIGPDPDRTRYYRLLWELGP